MWNGRLKDKNKAICNFCDTDFNGTDGINGGRFENAESLVKVLIKFWPEKKANKFVVFTGGEPLLQLDASLIKAMKSNNFTIAIETNGTISAPQGIDWICVSPKANTKLRLTTGDEIKIVYPQKNIEPKKYLNMQFKHFYLQPMDGPNREVNIQKTLKYIMKHPEWKISLQTHKFIGIR